MPDDVPELYRAYIEGAPMASKTQNGHPTLPVFLLSIRRLAREMATAKPARLVRAESAGHANGENTAQAIMLLAAVQEISGFQWWQRLA